MNFFTPVKQAVPSTTWTGALQECAEEYFHWGNREVRVYTVAGEKVGFLVPSESKFSYIKLASCFLIIPPILMLIVKVISGYSRSIRMAENIPAATTRNLANVQKLWRGRQARRAFTAAKAARAAALAAAMAAARVARRAAEQAYIQRDRRSVEDLAYSYALGNNASRAAYFVDWDKDDPRLFNPAYPLSFVFRNASSENGGIGFADLENLHKTGLIDTASRQMFHKLLSDLCVGNPILDHYNNPFSEENTNRLRQMVFAIVNSLNTRRDESDFFSTYSTVIIRVFLAFQHCSKQINVGIEQVFYALSAPKGASLGVYIGKVLQEMRSAILHHAVHESIKHDPYYLEHEAASVSHYYAHFGELLGLPPSAAALDERYASYAKLGIENEILDIYHRNYTVAQIVMEIRNAINNPEDRRILSSQVGDWFSERLPKLQQDTVEELYDERGGYTAKAVLLILEELNIVEPRRNLSPQIQA